MADVPPYPQSNGDAGEVAGTPRWVYVLGILVIVLVMGFIIMHLGAGGLGRHAR